ncbi:SIMPL domain-containing protein [Paenibacillus paeoniae]|uniref:DUF541 domain-containing protein n=1 Tax=Paenibacillus paeoniae TaxID=2292705 RepID=A0A371P685_9BACL|nr:SIMPL domain-containing protein [Paenibacillus paeoniae]REK71385.1 DUF541 domain-containing protein [Paenibacillus paeoniae]
MNGMSGNHSGENSCDFTIEVVGEGHVSAAPDRTLITLGAATENKDVQPAQSENAEISTAIIEALTGLGIPRSHIQTKSYTVEPQYDYEDGKQVFRNYKVTHLLLITLDGIAAAGKVIDTAVTSGANLVVDISFASSESEKHEAEALALAVQDAQAKAASIAAALGVSISAVPCKVQQIVRDSESVRYKSALMASDASTPIEPGQLTFKAAVRVWYLFA